MVGSGDCELVSAEINRKRKRDEMLFSSEEVEMSSRFQLNQLNQDLLERVLSWLPTSSFLRLQSVCKTWKSVADSSAFKLACSQVPSRDPWFLMVDSQPDIINQSPVVFDSSEENWKKLHLPPSAPSQNQDSCCDFIPVSASGGLICAHNTTGDFIVYNPVTGSSQSLLALEPVPEQPVQAIAMKTASNNSNSSFKLVLVSGELSNLKFRAYDSVSGQWGEETLLSPRKNHNHPRAADSEANDYDDGDEFTQYFLSKCGNVVSTDIQRNPCKQYSSILTLEHGEELLHFLSSSGSLVCCNLTRKFFFTYPRLLPVFSEYSIDLVEWGGQVCVVLLSEFLETASLRVWTWDDCSRSWLQIAAMSPSMSHRFYGKKVDINCSGGGKKLLVCLNSSEICSYVMCDLGTNKWVELPHFGEQREFACAFSFEPRIEASI